MQETFKNILKNGAVMFAVGMLLAVAAPPLANFLGGSDQLGVEAYKHAIRTPVLWTGAFFGAFGAIHAAAAPLFDYVFGGKEKKLAPAPEIAQIPEAAIAIHQNVACAPAVEIERKSVKKTDYALIIDQQRQQQSANQLL